MPASNLWIDSVRGGIGVLFPGFPVEGAEQVVPTPQHAAGISRGQCMVYRRRHVKTPVVSVRGLSPARAVGLVADDGGVKAYTGFFQHGQRQGRSPSLGDADALRYVHGWIPV